MSLTSLRMGQACGPKSTGAWGITEWLPIMVKSSVALGFLPKLCGVSWDFPERLIVADSLPLVRPARCVGPAGCRRKDVR